MHTRMLLKLFVTTALVLPGLGQSTWFVDASAPGGGTGAPSAPFRTLQEAVAHPNVVTGDTLSVAPGVYLNGVTLGPKGLTIRAVGGPAVTEVQLPSGGNGFSSPMFGPLVTIEGFTISGSSQFDSVGVRGGNVVVRSCVIRGHDGPFPEASKGLFSLYDMWVENCTVFDNEIGLDTGISSAAAWVSNSIITSSDVVDIAGNGLMSYSLWNSSWLPTWTPGNLAGVPGFWDPTNGNLRLAPGSRCIDAGNPAMFDPDGSRRDIGAFVFDSGYAPPAQTYCTAKVNSLGCTPAISASGSASVSSTSPFFVLCSNQISDRLGFLTYGFQAQSNPYQGGWKCVRAPSVRTSPQNSGGSAGGIDCSGVFSFDFNAHVQSGGHSLLQPGVFVYAQYWARDPGASFGSNRSDALRFGLGL